MSDPGQFAFGLAFGMAALGFFFGPIGKALAGRIGGHRGVDPETGLSTGEMVAERVAALEERIVELEGERTQLEERLDFAERVLARGATESREIGPGPAASG